MARIALITGGNRGLGFATAAALARSGDTVVVSARSDKDARAAAESLQAQGLSAEWLVLDVSSDDSVAAAVVEFGRRHDRLDVLVNNAGILPEAVASAATAFADPCVFRQTFHTNVFGPVAVIEGFLPALLRSPAARVVNVSSTVGSLADQTDPGSPYYQLVLPAYQSSKAALNSVTIGLSKRLAGTSVKVTAVCPGHVQTDLTPYNRSQAPLTADEAAQVVVAAANLPDDAASGQFIDRHGAVAW